MNNDFVVVIPARYASTRLPGKPLRDIAGKPMLQHVFDRGVESGASLVIIATDDTRIRRAAEEFGATTCMTSDQHRSGTERLAEVSRIYDWDGDQVVVNLQGDEPLMPAALIRQCAELLHAGTVEMATLASPIEDGEEFNNPNVVKVLVDNQDDAMYFSRAAIPYSRSDATDSLAIHTALHHHGLYAYRVRTLQQLVAEQPSAAEQCEQLEQLRALQLGIRIRVGRPVVRPGPGVDTEDDLQKAAEALAAAARRVAD